MLFTHLTKKALKIAYRARGIQLDDDGVPLIDSSFSLAEQMEGEYAVCAALLYDVVDGSRYTVDELKREGFPDEVVDAVELLACGDKSDYYDYIYSLKSDYTAKQVMLADLKSKCAYLSKTGADDLLLDRSKTAITVLEHRESPEIETLYETLRIISEGFYTLNGSTVTLKAGYKAAKKAEVFLPDSIPGLAQGIKPLLPSDSKCAFSCKNIDSFTMAREIYAAEPFNDTEDKVFVLNFANPVNPGGGVRRGAHAQEEDLCRQSSLLLSLESKEAKRYYSYNASLRTFLGSDAMIVSPDVEIIRNGRGELLEETSVVSVLTCAAPYLARGLEGHTQEEYRSMLYNRIKAMLICAASRGYTRLVLGAWGCGAFLNDAGVVAELFHKAITEFSVNGFDYNRFFRRIDFAVLSRNPEGYNFSCFKRYFSE